MGASRFVGRVGGLAVALGVGTAILTGGSVAWADETPTTGEQGVAAPDAPPTLDTPPATDGAQQDGATGDSLGQSSRAKLMKRLSELTPGTEEARAARLARLGQVTSSGGALTSSRVQQTDQGGDDAPRRGRSFKRADRDPNNVAAFSSPPVTVIPNVSRDVTVKADESGAAARQRGIEWLASKRAVAGRAAGPVSGQPGFTTLVRPTVTITQTGQPVWPGTGVAKSSRKVTNLLAAVFNPLAGNTPDGLPIDNPAGLLVAGAARRELGVDADSPSLLVAPTIAYDPTLIIDNGIITGENLDPTTSSRGYALAYEVISDPAVVGDPSVGGKVDFDETTGDFTYLPYATTVQSGSEQFSVMVNEITPLVARLESVPLVGGLVKPIIVTLHKIPILGTALSPIIGYATVVTVTVDPSAINTTAAPIAYTYMVTSQVDGTLISTNFFPAGETASQSENPTILYGPGLGGAGATSPTDPMLSMLRSQGYNVVTWDPRGEFASGGVLQLDNPQFEGRDVQSIISWVADQDGVELDKLGDPRMGMVGGSYGGGIQIAATLVDTEHRIDAIAPIITWNLLTDSLYPNEAFKTSYATLLLLDLVTTGARINPQIYSGILTGALFGVLTESQQALLRSSGSGPLAANITIPTLLIQGTVDVLFPLEQSIINAGYISGNGTTVKVDWFCGGHGICLQKNDGNADAFVLSESLAWMNTYVKEDEPPENDPKFTWVDQNGDYYSSDKLPSDADFNDPTQAIHTHSGTGGVLPIIPLVGGSGPAPALPDGFPESLGNGSPASNAVTIDLNTPDGTAYVVGSPTMTMTYQGRGTSKHVYAQIVDRDTGLVVGNVVSPIPVTLNGKPQTITVPIPLQAIAYTMDPNSHLQLQIVTSAVPFLNLTEWGVINVKSVDIDLPVAADVQAGKQWDPSAMMLAAV